MFAQNVNGQKTYSDYKGKPITFLGIDYTSAIFVDSVGFPIKKDLALFISQWNNFFIKESDKYDIKKAFHAQNIVLDLSQVGVHNAKIDTNIIVKTTPTVLTSDDCLAIAKTYDFSKLDGLVVLMIAECYNKPDLKGSHVVLIIDVNTEEVVFKRKYWTLPQGFGRRNYWARSIYNCLRMLEDDLETL